MKSKRNYKNKKFKKTRSKKGPGLLNTQKILDLPECELVKFPARYKYNKLTSEEANFIYNKCCPKSSLTGKANNNFKCKNLYQTYLNKIKQEEQSNPRYLNYLNKIKQEEEIQPVEINEDNDEINEDFHYNNQINNDNDNISNQFTDALIEEQTQPRNSEDSFIKARRDAAAAKPKEEIMPNPTYIQNLKAYGFNEKYNELSEKYPEGSYKPYEENKKWYQFWRKKGGKKTLRKKTKKTKNTKKKH